MASVLSGPSQSGIRTASAAAGTLHRACCRRHVSISPPCSLNQRQESRSATSQRRLYTLNSRKHSAPFTTTAAASSNVDHVDAVVVGGGPAGIAVVGNLLEQLPSTQRQLWTDPTFGSGRVGARYREVPSNTKVSLFLQFATALAPFRHILENAKEPNAATALQALRQDKGCELSHAADMCLMLTEGLSRHYATEVEQQQGQVLAAVLDKQANSWTAALDSGKVVRTQRLVLCTGSSPISSLPPTLAQKPHLFQSGPGIANLDLDIALKPSALAQTLSASSPSTVAVVGASHSAILVLMNLYNLAATTHPHLRIKWFTRHKELKYAKEMDGWILYDNTGLKGEAAQWARENLEEDTFASSPVSKVVTKLWTPVAEGKEEAAYEAELPGCTHIIQAIGYKRNPIPELAVVDQPGEAPKPLSVEPDSLTGRFIQGGKAGDSGASVYVPGLFGAGIAFPERVTDPAGNVEHAVGLWKFMRFLRRVVPQWVKEP